jgi:hypothetical protein
MTNFSAQNYWAFGLCPSSSILKTREHYVLKTGSASIPWCGGRPLGLLEIANFNYWTSVTLHYITLQYSALHSPDPRLVKTTAGCGICHINTKAYIQYN